MHFLLSIEGLHLSFRFDAANADELTDRMYELGGILPGICQTEGVSLVEVSQHRASLYYVEMGSLFPEAMSSPYSFAAVGILKQDVLKFLYLSGQVADSIMVRARELYQQFQQRQLRGTP